MNERTNERTNLAKDHHVRVYTAITWLHHKVHDLNKELHGSGNDAHRHKTRNVWEEQGEKHHGRLRDYDTVDSEQSDIVQKYTDHDRALFMVRCGISSQVPSTLNVGRHAQ